MSDSTNGYERFAEAELDIAKSTDMPALLEQLGYQVTRKGRYHSTKEMDSLRIKLRRTWFRYSENIGGDAISFLQHFHSMSFVDAVSYLLVFNGYSHSTPSFIPSPAPSIKNGEAAAIPFTLPSANDEHRHVYAYLRKRGIAQQVITCFLDAGLLYEDQPHHNCVFVGRDSSGKPAFACKRGTYDKDGSGFKSGVEGSDKGVAFPLSCDPAVNSVHVFESPIDLMSYITLHRELRGNALALCCLHDGALETYLKQNPHLTDIVLCLDADKWGLEAAARMSEKCTSLGYAVSVQRPPREKDWNEFLQSTQQKNKIEGE
ncbi:MAG TPA: toprim domain-containing protein [Clostridia bacterium]|nr:toprim domain-containing protein [Clostridia bacterium]